MLVVSLPGLLAMGELAVSCGNSSNGGANETPSSDMGGRAGAGSQSGVGSSSGAGGGTQSVAGAPVGCQEHNAALAPGDTVIADFSSADSPLKIPATISVYSPEGTAPPVVDTSGGVLRVTLHATGRGGKQISGVRITFNDCVDASAFFGVRFSIGGTASPVCHLRYLTNYSSVTDVMQDNKGTCLLGSDDCYAPSTPITVPEVPTGRQFPWAASGGNPSGPLDPTTLTSLEWQFYVPSFSDICDAEFSIKDLRFF